MALLDEQVALMNEGRAIIGHCAVCRESHFYGELPMGNAEAVKIMTRAKCPNDKRHTIYMGPYVPPPKTFKVSILWGRVPEPGEETKTYAFETQVELDAFQTGVDAAIGWMEYRETLEGHVQAEDDP